MSRVKRSKSLPKAVSKIFVKEHNSKLVTGDKLCLQDEQEIKEGEYTWEVKVKEASTYNKRLLVVSPTAVRVLLIETHEEVAMYPYSRMKEFSQNEVYKSFQIVWYPSKNIEESIYFKTSEGAEIQNMIGKFIKELLVAKNVANPNVIMDQHTFECAPDIEKLKTGGRTRSKSTHTTKQVKQKKATSTKENEDSNTTNRKKTNE